MEQIKVENESSVAKKIFIQVSNDEVNSMFDEYYKDLSKKVVLNGFRKGNIPRSVLESQFGIQAKSFVSQELFNKYYKKALADNAITPVALPIVSEMDVERKIIGKFDNDGFSANVYVEIFPVIDPVGYTGMNLKIPQTDEMPLIEDKFAELQDKFAERRPIEDRPAQMGDTAIVEFIGSLNGQEIKGLKEDAYTIKLGAGQTIAGFDDKIIGLKIGEEKKFDLTYPIENESIGGKVITFKAKLLNLISVTPAPIDDELALMAGFSTLEELKTAVKDEVKAIVNRVNKGNLELQIISKLVKDNKVEIPEMMAQEEKNRIIQNVKNRGTEVDQQTANNIESSARYNIARSILIESIYNKEASLEITPDELDKALEKHAKINNVAKDKFLSDLYNSKRMDVFMGQLKTEKVLDFIISKAQQESEEENG